MTRAVAAADAGRSGQTRAILPEQDAEGLAGKGFARLPCSDAFASLEDAIAWRDKICRVTAVLPESMQGQLGRRLGERPAVLCGMAEQVLGQWDQAGARER